MKKFAKRVYGGCKEIVLGGPTGHIATGLLVGYLCRRTWKLVNRTREIEMDYMDLRKKQLESKKSAMDSARTLTPNSPLATPLSFRMLRSARSFGGGGGTINSAG
ncbi:hypothetical protein MKW98_017036 [Papaver atlanticum]|uniref:Uncharacterized protein n=1 Tax=Papaver atlanticum TaxID=357466 RepID=A0AAD4TK62_9MAGN|nr:hypothetical protein MKW98_017036 [Papaver atlanticum]